jgi:hypothetical protein
MLFHRVMNCASLALTLIGLWGCSSGGVTTGGGGSAGGGGASSSGGSATGGSATGGTGGGCGGCIELCEGGACSCYCPTSCEGFLRPALRKDCTADADCFAGIHAADCCGSVVVLGYNRDAQAAFDAYEADCAPRATCECLSQPPTLENGQATSDLELRTAVCISGQCNGTGPVNVGTP